MTSHGGPTDRISRRGRGTARPRPLGRAVESVWYARGTVPYDRERIAPTGSTVAVIVLGDAIRQTAYDGDGLAVESATGLLIGPHDRPIINEPTGETHAVGIVTTPVGAEAALGLRPAGYRGRVEGLRRAWPVAQDLRDDAVTSWLRDAYNASG